MNESDKDGASDFEASAEPGDSSQYDDKSRVVREDDVARSESLTMADEAVAPRRDNPVSLREDAVKRREDVADSREDTAHRREETATFREQVIRETGVAQAASDAHLMMMRQANAHLVMSGIEAARASQLKDEFLAMVSHELKNPLNAILAYSQLILGGKMKQEDVHTAIQVIERCARAQNKLIEDLLQINSMILGKVLLDRQHLDIVSLVNEAIESVKPTAETKKIILQKTIDRGPGWIWGDANRLQQILWNLLSNAIKFTPSGGRIEIIVEQIGSSLEINIHDTGSGISPDFMPYVFDRFRQADASLSRQHGGLGVGLAIVKQLVELHGGTVRAESAGVGKGSSFIVALPLPAASDRGGDEPFPLEIESHRGETFHSQE